MVRDPKKATKKTTAKKSVAKKTAVKKRGAVTVKKSSVVNSFAQDLPREEVFVLPVENCIDPDDLYMSLRIPRDPDLSQIDKPADGSMLPALICVGIVIIVALMLIFHRTG